MYVFDSLLKHHLTRDNTFALIRSCGNDVYKVEKYQILNISFIYVPHFTVTLILSCLVLSRFKYGVRSLNTKHFHSYCFSKNDLFMGKNNLDTRTIDLNLNVNLAIEILYQYEYVAQV